MDHIQQETKGKTRIFQVFVLGNSDNRPKFSMNFKGVVGRLEE